MAYTGANLRGDERRTVCAAGAPSGIGDLPAGVVRITSYNVCYTKLLRAFDRDAYTRWLHRLRDVCTRRDIVLIFSYNFV